MRLLMAVIVVLSVTTFMPAGQSASQTTTKRRKAEASRKSTKGESFLDELLEDQSDEGSGWLPLHVSTRRSTFKYHEGQITVRGMRVSAWVKERLKSPRSVTLKDLTEERAEMFGRLARSTPETAVTGRKALARYNQYSHTLWQYEFDCSSRELRDRGAVDYDRRGAVIYSSTNVVPEWKTVVPDSVGESMLKFFCKRAVR